MNTWAIVPVKPFNRAKSRLAGVLSPQQRERLALLMLRNTLRVLTSVEALQGVLVISRDTKALAEARKVEGVQTLQESGTPELNHALRRATQMLMAWGAEGILILPADIPLLSAHDVGTILARGGENIIVISPDRQGDGTNAIFACPPDVIPFDFGVGSFQKHMQLAQRARVQIEIFRSEGLELDIDTPEDLTNYAKLARKLGQRVIDYRTVNEM